MQVDGDLENVLRSKLRSPRSPSTDQRVCNRLALNDACAAWLSNRTSCATRHQHRVVGQAAGPGSGRRGQRKGTTGGRAHSCTLLPDDVDACMLSHSKRRLQQLAEGWRSRCPHSPLDARALVTMLLRSASVRPQVVGRLRRLPTQHPSPDTLSLAIQSSPAGCWLVHSERRIIWPSLKDP